MSSGERRRNREARLAADNRCINCADKLVFDDIGRVRECSKCRADRAERHQNRAQARRAAGECPMCGADAVDDYTCCAACRKDARERFAATVSANNPNRNGPQPATRWKDAEFAPSCGRCGLRGDHECIPVGRYATARRIA